MNVDHPSLNALRAFEAAARCGSFVQAATELGVTSAAVSQLVRGLEADMGRQLFLRQGNRLLLTDAGREIYPALEIAFREIASIIPFQDGTAAQSRSRKRLILSVLPWLAPWAMSALQGYDAPLELRVEADPVALTEGAADLRLTYGGALYPDHKVVPLFHDHMVIAQVSPEPVMQDTFVQVNWGAAYASLPGWTAWHRQMGLANPDLTQSHSVNDPHLALELVRQGKGAALVPALLTPPDLAQTDTGFRLPWPYALICLNARARNRPLADLIAHLSAKADPYRALAQSVTPG